MSSIIRKWHLLDADDVFAYKVPRTVKIRDRKLGIARILLLIGLFVYVIIYEIILQKGYLSKENPAGFYARVSVRNDRSGTPSTPTTSLPFCCPTDGCQEVGFQSVRGRLPCVVWNGHDSVYPSSEEFSSFITTRVTVTDYVPIPVACAVNAQVPGQACGGWVEQAAGTNGSKKAYYVAGAEDHTVLIRHSIYGQKNDLMLDSVRDMPKARLSNQDGDYIRNFCDLSRTGDMDIQCDDDGNEAALRRPGDIMTLREMFDAAGLAPTSAGASADAALYMDRLSGGQADTLRYDGVVMLVVVDYRGTSAGKDTVKYTYRLKYVPSAEYKYEEVKEYSYVDRVTGVHMVKRRVYNRHGVRIIVVFSGWMGKFSFTELLKTLVTGLAILAISKKVMEYVVMRLLPHADIYRRYRNVRTVDFSDIKPGTHELQDGKTTTWGGKHLTDEVFVYGELDDSDKEESDRIRRQSQGIEDDDNDDVNNKAAVDAPADMAAGGPAVTKPEHNGAPARRQQPRQQYQLTKQATTPSPPHAQGVQADEPYARNPLFDDPYFPRHQHRPRPHPSDVRYYDVEPHPGRRTRSSSPVLR